MQRQLTVWHLPHSGDAILSAIGELGFTASIHESGGALAAEGATSDAKPWWPLALAGVAALGSEAINWMGGAVWIEAVLALLAVLACGTSTYKKGWIAIRHRNLNINALMSIAVTGALLLGQWPEAAMVMVLFTIAELIEAKSLDRARNAIAGLMRLAPDTATVAQADGTWREVDAKAVAIGDRVRVKPGERIALDGTVTLGQTTIDQAPITGESLPIDKKAGEAIFAGTINLSGVFEYRVTATANSTTLARIIHAVEEAQGKKASIQRFVDQFARIYTPFVLGVAILIAILPPLLMGGAWFAWIYKALVLLVIACPCALVISTPVTVVSGLAAAARHGILIKGGIYLEEGRKLKWLALDKTGTITHGKLIQTGFVTLANASTEACLIRAHSLASLTDHPVSQAIAKAAQATNTGVLPVQDFSAILGRGVKGKIDGVRYSLGNHRLVEENGLCSPELESRIDELERQGKTVVMLCDVQQVLALFAVSDTVKESSRRAIEELHALGVKTLMLSGDNPHTAEVIGKQVGIDEVRGNQLPEDKARVIEEFAGKGLIGMVGDGINDAPALARAHIGFAMGAMGTDTAIETADVALMDDDLGKIPVFIRLSRATRSIILQNIALALGIKSVFLIMTLIGTGTMWMAVFADVGASLLVVGNGLRLLRK